VPLRAYPLFTLSSAGEQSHAGPCGGPTRRTSYTRQIRAVRSSIRRMDRRQRLLESLAQAERDVQLGQTQLAEQQALVDQMRRNGLDFTQAGQTLATLEAAQRTHLEGRDNLRWEVAASTREPKQPP
jgi:hypothetical protein